MYKQILEEFKNKNNNVTPSKALSNDLERQEKSMMLMVDSMVGEFEKQFNTLLKDKENEIIDSSRDNHEETNHEEENPNTDLSYKRLISIKDKIRDSIASLDLFDRMIFELEAGVEERLKKRQ